MWAEWHDRLDDDPRAAVLWLDYNGFDQGPHHLPAALEVQCVDAFSHPATKGFEGVPHAGVAGAARHEKRLARANGGGHWRPAKRGRVLLGAQSPRESLTPATCRAPQIVATPWGEHAGENSH